MLVLVILSAAGCANRGLVIPEPIRGASSFDRTERAIKDALRREGWVVEGMEQGECFAVPGDSESHPLANYDLRIRIIYDKDSVQIDSVDMPDVKGDSPAAAADRRKQIRRSLQVLSNRLEYLIESADLAPKE